MVRKHHPHPEKLTQGMFKLHQRNIYQICGPYGVNTNELSELVIYCADMGTDGLPIGGTRTTISIAAANHIPTYNIRIKLDLQNLLSLYGIEV